MTAAEQKICQNCKSSFVIEPEDFDFYKKIDVPSPTFCPECRMIRRMAIRNEHFLYKNICQLCKKEVVSVVSPDKNIAVYCSECYKSDNWDSMIYGREYDFSQDFFSQINTLMRQVPREALRVRNCVNCSFSEDIGDSKNCYLSAGAYLSQDCFYSYSPIATKKALDCTFIFRGDTLYEIADSSGCYNCKFSQFLDESLDCDFLYGSSGCSDCFGGVNLRNKRYVLFNKQFSKEEYKKERAKWDLGSYKILSEAKRKFQELYLTTPRRFANIINCSNVVGNGLGNTKNCYWCFTTEEGVENCKYLYLGGLALKDSYDICAAGDKSQLIYEAFGVVGSANIKFSNKIYNSQNIEYSNDCQNCINIFGCSGLKNKKYCIFNKQYSKADYFSLREKIIKQMKNVSYRDQAGRAYNYGEFFPIEISPFCFNESLAMEKFPIDEKSALMNYLPWKERPQSYSTISLLSKDIPDHINETSDDILNQVIECANAKKNKESCTQAFKIIPQELQFYRQVKLALPRYCPNCRYAVREDRRHPLNLWSRQCQCSGSNSENRVYKNTTKHNHGNSPCSEIFQTGFSPDQKEIVYCEQCYQQEVLS